MGKVRKSRWLSPLTSRPNFVSIPTSTLVQRGNWPPPGRRLGREGAIRFWKSSSQGSDPRKRWFIPLVSTGMLTSDSCDLGCRKLSSRNTALRSLIGRTLQGTASARSRSPIRSPPTGAGCLRDSLILRLESGKFPGKWTNTEMYSLCNRSKGLHVQTGVQ